MSLRRAGYTIEAVIARSNSASLNTARRLAREARAQVLTGVPSSLRAKVIWFCVPDAKIKSTAKSWAKFDWRGKIAVHSSGALTSDELAPLRLQGAAAASVHPFMTFVRGSQPALTGVPFAIEGDAAATRVARRIVIDLGGHAFSIRKTNKAAYHAWGTFASPFLVTLLVMAEQVAAMAGISKNAARRRMTPILQETLANYARLGARGAFSGPIIRGDVDTVRRHLQVLRRNAGALDVYLSMARNAVRNLPARNQHELMKALPRKRLA